VGESSATRQNLPGVPSDAAPTGLHGVIVPVGEVVLTSVQGDRVDVGRLASGTLVLYCFGNTADELLSGGLIDRFVHCYMELRALGATVAGVSAEPIEVLEGAVAGAQMQQLKEDSCLLLCDEDLILADNVGLPTLAVGRGRVYERLILVAQKHEIAWVRRATDRTAAANATLAWVQQRCSEDRPLTRRVRELERWQATHAGTDVFPLDGVRKALSEIEQQRSEFEKRARLAEQQEHRLRSLLHPPTAHGEQGPEDRLRDLITWQWAQVLREPYDWTECPLVRYTFEEGFRQYAEQASTAALAGIAWVCAMIACGVAGRLAGLTLTQLRTGAGGDCSELWRCDVSLGTIAHVEDIEYHLLTSGEIVFRALRGPK
jgi:hypothetical protein